MEIGGSCCAKMGVFTCCVGKREGPFVHELKVLPNHCGCRGGGCRGVRRVMAVMIGGTRGFARNSRHTRKHSSSTHITCTWSKAYNCRLHGCAAHIVVVVLIAWLESINIRMHGGIRNDRTTAHHRECTGTVLETTRLQQLLFSASRMKRIC